MENIKKGRTNVDFIRTEAKLGERDGEIVVTCTAKLQTEKFGIDGLDDVWRKRFPHVSRKGVFIVSGKAVCGEEPFNFDKGMRIAETRAQEKAYIIAAKIYHMITKEMESITQYFEALHKNSSTCAVNAANHICDLDIESPIK